MQLCWEVNNDNQYREINGIKKAMIETKVENGIIITNDQEEFQMAFT